LVSVHNRTSGRDSVRAAERATPPDAFDW